MPVTLYRGKGCSLCGLTGYRGRLAIFEALQVDEKMKVLITNPEFDLQAVRVHAREMGMKTMFEDGLQ
jgi:type II secretory ATPase GspE/PulE/Tfp pilus assembly ATPase PilB-like protein